MLVLLGAAALLFCPLKIRLTLRRHALPEGVLEVHYLLLHLHFPFRVTQTPRGGHQLTFLPRRPREKPRPASPSQVQQGAVLLGTFLRADHARRFLLRHLHLHFLRGTVRLALQDAAGCALICGALWSLIALMPPRLQDRIRLHVQPDFFTGHSSYALQGMISIQTGILLIIGGLTLLSWLLERREHHALMKEA